MSREDASPPPGARSLGSSFRIGVDLLVVFSVLALAPPPGAEAQEWTLERELTIGEALGAESALTPVAGVALDGRDRVYVGQPMDRLIRVFSSDGRFLREIGARGRGPGEVQSLSSFDLLGDSLWISDLGQDRISWFSLGGELLDTRPWRLRLGNGATRRGVPEQILRDGYAVAAPTLTFGRTRTPEELSALPVYLVAPDRTVIRKLSSLPAEKWVLLLTFEGGRVVSSFQPLRDTPIIESLPDGAGFVEVHRPAPDARERGRFRVVIRSPRGDSTAGWEIAYRPVPVSEELRERYVARAARKITRFPSGPAEGKAREIAERALFLPDFHPPVSELVVGRDGRLWLRRERTAGHRDRWEAYTRAGRRLGAVTVQRDLRVLAANRDTLWAARTTEAGVPRVLKLSVVRE